ncbi:N-acetylmuramoyl-L-alanine amidase [Luteibacter sp. Sphag1AF]|uniref:N-acetylmuramoyl-L-alanine amidase n=1 Tax=Luteibacter sp. Sphag1AF TaxID=2587031 RepID=UPI00161CC01F|nr:N-acetylmuramoyl-L-alanine amidase [Luteibacter sp. Sphag1AF]MBB3229032.1 N-acetylmuramoyl-L-alanine amidase [Luteibacter sp. Sphag1AF]
MNDIHACPLPYESLLPVRLPEQVDLVVIHCTELPDLATAREYGEKALYDSGVGNSGHYYVDRDGTLLCYVDPLRVANHTRGFNPRSIGIELVNTGRFPEWFRSDNQVMTEPYPAAQIDALCDLLAILRERFPSLKLIAGHEDLDLAVVPASDDPSQSVPRKRDPGPMFPWDAVTKRVPLKRWAAP